MFLRLSFFPFSLLLCFISILLISIPLLTPFPTHNTPYNALITDSTKPSLSLPFSGNARSSSTSSTSSSSPAFTTPSATRSSPLLAGYNVDLTGKVAFVAGVADSTGYGWAIAKSLAEAGATIIIGTWPPVLKIFETGLRKGDFEEDMKLVNGGKMEIAKIYPLDAVFDTPADVPEAILTNKRYAGLEGYTISEVAKAVEADYGKIDILVHSLANGPEVTKPLLETSRAGYLAASSASAYSFVSLLSNFAPLMNEGGSALSLTYIASEKVIPGYGGGMSSAKVRSEKRREGMRGDRGEAKEKRRNAHGSGERGGAKGEKGRGKGDRGC